MNPILRFYVETTDPYADFSWEYCVGVPRVGDTVGHRGIEYIVTGVKWENGSTVHIFIKEIKEND